jgi:hypothetical protein
MTTFQPPGALGWLSARTVPTKAYGQTNADGLFFYINNLFSETLFFFNNNYLVYLNDNPGEFIVNDNSYSITKNTAYVFSEGLAHKTLNTGTEPRLLLGPMNEFAHPVGNGIMYYETFSDASTHRPSIAYSDSFVVGKISHGTLKGFTQWKMTEKSTGSSSKTDKYQNGAELIPDGNYYLFPCMV